MTMEMVERIGFHHSKNGNSGYHMNYLLLLSMVTIHPTAQTIRPPRARYTNIEVAVCRNHYLGQRYTVACFPLSTGITWHSYPYCYLQFSIMHACPIDIFRHAQIIMLVRLHNVLIILSSSSFFQTPSPSSQKKKSNQTVVSSLSIILIKQNQPNSSSFLIFPNLNHSSKSHHPPNQNHSARPRFPRQRTALLLRRRIRTARTRLLKRRTRARCRGTRRSSCR